MYIYMHGVCSADWAAVRTFLSCLHICHFWRALHEPFVTGLLVQNLEERIGKRSVLSGCALLPLLSDFSRGASGAVHRLCR